MSLHMLVFHEAKAETAVYTQRFAIVLKFVINVFFSLVESMTWAVSI